MIQAKSIMESMASKAGTETGSLSKAIDKMMQPKVDWRSELRQFFNEAKHNDYSWAHPNRRFIDDGIYLPGTFSNEMGAVVFVVDTSGSMTMEINKLMNQVWSEVKAIIQEARPTQSVVVQSDSEVRRVEKYEEGEELPEKIDVVGGGGTLFNPVLRKVKDLVENPTEDFRSPALMIYFTDMETAEMGSDLTDPGCPVAWAKFKGMYKDWQVKPEFGVVIDVD